MNVDSLIRELNPTPRGGLDDPGSLEAQMIFDRVKHRVGTRRAARRRSQVGLAIAALGMAAVAGVVISAPFSRSSSTAVRGTGPVAVSHAKAPVLRLASYSLQLPAGYRLTSHCADLGVAYSSTPPPGQGATDTASRADSPQYASRIAAQAHAEGGCIAMVLAPPYTPTATDPDPQTQHLVGAHAVQVGRYSGFAGTSTLYAKPSDTRSEMEWLYVQIPLTGGQDQDLVVSSTGLTQSALVALVSNGLSVASGSGSA